LPQLANGAYRALAPQALAETSPQFYESYFTPRIGIPLETAFASYGQLYRSQVWIRAAVDKIANSVARLPLKVWDETPGKGRTIDTDSPYAQLMAKPCPTMSTFSFKFWVAAKVEIYGEAFAVKIREGRGRQVTGLVPMHPSMTTIRRNEYGEKRYRFLGRPNEEFTEDDVVEWLLYNPDNTMRGMSRLESLRSTLMQEDSTRRAMQAFWQNGARPSVIMRSKRELGDDGRARVQKALSAQHGGSANRGRVVVFENDEFEEPMIVQQSAEEMQYIEGRRLSREEVCFAPGARIMTGNGFTPIESIKVGDTVLSHRGRFRPVTAVMVRRHNGDMIRVQARSLNEVLVTDNHPFLVQRITQTRSKTQHRDGPAEWIAAGEITGRRRQRDGAFARGEYQALTIPRLQATGPGTVDLARWARSSSSITAETVSGGSNGRAIPVPRIVKASYELGWLVGLFVADGSATDHQVCWYLGPREDHLAQQIRMYVRNVFGVDTAIRRTGSVIRAIVSSRPLADFFDQFGHRAPRKHLSEWCLTESQEFREGIINGIGVGDGHEAAGRMRVATTSLTLAWQLRLLLWAAGHHSIMTADSRRTYQIEGRCGDRAELWEISWSIDDAGRYTLHGGDFEHFYVKSAVSEKYSGPVYNLSVQDDESYVTEGGTVHNCAGMDVPPAALQDMSKANVTNVVENMRSLYRECVAYRIEFLESGLSDSVGSEFYGPKVAKFDMKHVTRGAWEQRVAAHAQAIQSGAEMPGEAREDLDLPDAGPLSHKLYAQAQLQPLGHPAMMERLTIAGQVGAPTPPDQLPTVVPPATPGGGSADSTAVPHLNGDGATPVPHVISKHIRDIAGMVGRGKTLQEAAQHLVTKTGDREGVREAFEFLLERQL
jgi:HK97 family phage portal protein